MTRRRADLIAGVAGLALLGLTSVACARIGCTPGVADPAFEGTWSSEDLRLLVGVTAVSGCRNNIWAAGTKDRGPWDALSFTGTIVAVGRARGTLTLWDRGAVVATLPDLELPRAADVITLQLRYTRPNGNEGDELFALRKETG